MSAFGYHVTVIGPRSEHRRDVDVRVDAELKPEDFWLCNNDENDMQVVAGFFRSYAEAVCFADDVFGYPEDGFRILLDEEDI